MDALKTYPLMEGAFLSLIRENVRSLRRTKKKARYKKRSRLEGKTFERKIRKKKSYRDFHPRLKVKLISKDDEKPDGDDEKPDGDDEKPDRLPENFKVAGVLHAYGVTNTGVRTRDETIVFPDGETAVLQGGDTKVTKILQDKIFRSYNLADVFAEECIIHSLKRLLELPDEDLQEHYRQCNKVSYPALFQYNERNDQYGMRTISTLQLNFQNAIRSTISQVSWQTSLKMLLLKSCRRVLQTLCMLVGLRFVLLIFFY